MDVNTEYFSNNLEVLLKEKLQVLSAKPKREDKEVDKLPLSVNRLYNENHKKNIRK